MMRSITLIFTIAGVALGSAVTNQEIIAERLADESVPGGVSVPLKVDYNEQTIEYSVPETQRYEAMDVLEDYEHSVGAMKSRDSKNCYVYNMKPSMEEMVQKYKEKSKAPGPLEPGDDLELAAVLAEDEPEEEFGTRIVNFCSDRTIYKIGKIQDEEPRDHNELDTSNAAERVNVTFRKCCIVFFFFVCHTITITIPTGSVVVFFWFG